MNTRRAQRALLAGAVGIVFAAGWDYMHPARITIEGYAHVTDGDTIVIGAAGGVLGVHVRLEGVDAEELDEPHGRAAKHAMQELVEGKWTRCALTGRTSYKRVVATCYVGAIEINREIVRRGFALDCAHYSHGAYRASEPAGSRTRLRQKAYCG